ncbi:hypothetical protein T439DRAFT_371835 [Meredithblackwellia eburnea MCA 4105]
MQEFRPAGLFCSLWFHFAGFLHTALLLSGGLMNIQSSSWCNVHLLSSFLLLLALLRPSVAAPAATTAPTTFAIVAPAFVQVGIPAVFSWTGPDPPYDIQILLNSTVAAHGKEMLPSEHGFAGNTLVDATGGDSEAKQTTGGTSSTAKHVTAGKPSSSSPGAPRVTIATTVIHQTQDNSMKTVTTTLTVQPSEEADPVQSVSETTYVYFQGAPNATSQGNLSGNSTVDPSDASALASAVNSTSAADSTSTSSSDSSSSSASTSTKTIVIIIILAVAILAIVGLVWWWFTRKKDNDDKGKNGQASDEEGLVAGKDKKGKDSSSDSESDNQRGRPASSKGSTKSSQSPAKGGGRKGSFDSRSGSESSDRSRTTKRKDGAKKNNSSSSGSDSGSSDSASDQGVAKGKPASQKKGSSKKPYDSPADSSDESDHGKKGQSQTNKSSGKGLSKKSLSDLGSGDESPPPASSTNKQGKR